MCRARVRSNQWHTAEVYEDARAAMRQFEKAGEGALVVDAASWAAAHLREKGRAIPRPTDITAHDSRTQPNSRGMLLGHRHGEFEDKPPLAGR